MRLDDILAKKDVNSFQDWHPRTHTQPPAKFPGNWFAFEVMHGEDGIAYVAIGQGWWDHDPKTGRWTRYLNDTYEPGQAEAIAKMFNSMGLQASEVSDSIWEVPEGRLTDVMGALTRMGGHPDTFGPQTTSTRPSDDRYPYLRNNQPGYSKFESEPATIKDIAGAAHWAYGVAFDTLYNAIGGYEADYHEGVGEGPTPFDKAWNVLSRTYWQNVPIQTHLYEVAQKFVQENPGATRRQLFDHVDRIAAQTAQAKLPELEQVMGRTLLK